VDLETEERGTNCKGGVGDSEIQGGKHHGMGVYGMEWSGASCRG
jgi:hypothetical protein